MKTLNQIVAAATNLNTVFNLEPAIDTGLDQSVIKGKIEQNTIEVLQELKSPFVKHLLGVPGAAQKGARKPSRNTSSVSKPSSDPW